MRNFIIDNRIGSLEATKNSTHPLALSYQQQGSAFYINGCDFALFNGAFNEDLANEDFNDGKEQL